MKLTGYTDRWTARPGEEVTVHVHAEADEYRATLVRLRHGDQNPRGPGFREIELPAVLDRTRPGRARRIRKGSFAVVDLGSRMDTPKRFEISAWIWPTLAGPGEQGILSWLSPGTGTGLGLFLEADRRLSVRQAGAEPIRTAVPVETRAWYRVAATVDAGAGTVTLTFTARDWSPDFDGPDVAVGTLAPRFRPSGAPLVIAAGWLERTDDGPAPQAAYNGKIARPAIAETPSDGGRLLAGWDFSVAPGTDRIAAIADGPDGRTFNRPARCMTGPEWPKGAPSTAPTAETHDAIHFHDDDVADVGWSADFALSLPPSLPSGVYAVRLRTADAEDHLPFFVAPPRTGPRSRLALLMPTMSYLAYANESLDVSDGIDTSPLQDMSINAAAYDYVIANGLRSTYDLHRDGSGIIHGSRRRPIIDFRPRARCRTFDAPHQFAADLHLVDWLTEKGYAFDVVTDDLLHAEGIGLLSDYRVLVTGSHPEYWTAPMLDARDRWLDEGGRLLYLGGNGFYWVTGVAEDSPDVIEVRRYVGTRTSSGDPGEETLAVSGERGGLWRDRGRSPHGRVGIGFSGQGFDRGVPFRRTARSREADCAWIFDGVADDLVGAGPALVLNHGAAGFEVDRTDARYGTPAHAAVLAATDRFTNAYQGAIETFNQLHPWTGGAHAASGVRAEIVLTHGPKGGAVFAAGSITWSSTLSADGYGSDTSRITANVLDAFLADGPLPGRS
jgi:N,N-dimethylformamidase